AVALLAAACGDSGSVMITTATPAGSGNAPVCTRQTVPGCTMAGFRFDPPLPLADALEVASDLNGTAIAVYRTDWECVPDTQFSPVDEQEEVASRFAYVDAAGIRERRVAAVDGGLAPPISGWHISQAYWDQWEAEWSRAQAAGVEIEGIAVWMSEEALAGAAADPRLAATEELPWRWTDSLDPSYPGELLMDGKGFPGLSTPEPPQC
ncbi:MAG: hypothetical protein MUP76_06400, partial [Acidimicrobiia bacterium]|nr:hypothetical protein [Acidimicrobiia bacterium]